MSLATVSWPTLSISRIWSDLRRWHTIRLILITPPPVNTHDRTDRDFEPTKSYAEAVKEVGARVSVPVAGGWTEIRDATGRDERACKQFLHDGPHLNAARYEIVFNSIMKIIGEKHPKIHYVKLQTVWTEVDINDSRPSLAKRRAIV